MAQSGVHFARCNDLLSEDTVEEMFSCSRVVWKSMIEFPLLLVEINKFCVTDRLG